MCSVQVLLFADVMGPRPSRSPNGVCRRLFADAPTEKSSADPGHFLRAMEAELRRRDVSRWNFDFEHEKPLPGRYQWVAVGEKRDREEVKSEVEEKEEVVIVDEVMRPQKVSSSKPECEKKNSGAGASQAKITDFLRKRKRVESNDDTKAIESKKLKIRRLNANLATTASPT